MSTVKLRFPGGRYHATPWGHHVNEGLIEWPPSPWRLLRALVASGFCHHGWTEVPPVARRLIDKLAAVLPMYRLPSASAAHSRHFMPYLEGKVQKTTLVFDTWANIGQGELFIHWPCDLDAEESELLGQLVSTLGYLGRSESWVEAELTEGVPVQWNAVPCQEGEHRGPGWEQISLLAAISPPSYDSWREKKINQATSYLELPKGKKKSAKLLDDERRKLQAPFPKTLLDCLVKDTVWWKGHGWSQPPGSQRVLYWRRCDSLQVSVPFAPRRLEAPRVKFMLLALTTPSGNRSALPPVTRTLPQAELLHRAIVSRLDNGQHSNCPELTGTDVQGRPLRNGHRHAHIIPVDLDGDGHIDHLVIHAKMGLGPAAQRAIRTLRRTWAKGGIGDLQLALVGQGDLQNLVQLPPPLKQGLGQLIGPPNGACTWVSLTPFVAPRHLKREGKKDDLFGQVQAELRSRNLPQATVEVLPLNTERFRRFRHFVRRRQASPPPPADIGYAIRLTFEQPQRGPISLGYASHFGLGLFAADKDVVAG